MGDTRLTEEAPEIGTEGGKTFTQDEVNALVGQARQDERRKAQAKYADYDELKTAAEGVKTADERIAALEQEIERSRLEALRSKYAADVPERLRPLLTGTTEDELKAQQALLVEGESDRIKRGNVAPKEGGSADSEPGPDDAMRTFTRELFADAAAD